MSVRIRSFLPTDSETIIALTPRLSEFELPAWYSTKQIDDTNISAIRTAMEELALEPDTAVYVAEDETTRQVVGFIRLQTQSEYFSKQRHGYIANIVVDQAYEGQGIGHMLLQTAERWAKEKGYAMLTLHTFAENRHAQKVYEKHGFQQDVIQYAKLLTRDS